ncbi:hypothetical protein K501DRAFT_335477 [Backusella circina FSU 941]|nr:hypothetical protein K501DRAFT_335477 [Backusella circina FSU 941]
MLKINVLARSVYEHHIYIERPNSTINWNFSTKQNSLCFGLFFKPCTDPVTTPPRVSRTNSTATSQTSSSKWTYSNATSCTSESDMTMSWKGGSMMGDKEFQELIAITRFQCSKQAVRGSFKAKTPGYYVLLFDNKFSINKKKSLYLTVTSDDPSFKNMESTPELSGWLQRKTQNMLNAYHKQWFEFLPSGVLRFYLKPDGPIIGSVQILFCAITTFASKKIIQVDSGTTRLCLKAITADDFDCWTTCFRNRCEIGMGESGIQSAKSVFEEERADTAPNQVLKSLGDLDVELETLKGLVNQALVKEAQFTKENQSLESSYQFSTVPARRNLSFRRSSTSTSSLSSHQVVPSSLGLRQHLEKMSVSVERIDQCKSRIYFNYMAQKNQQKDTESSERTVVEVDPLPQNDKSITVSAQPEEFYDAEGTNQIVPINNNNSNEKQQKPMTNDNKLIKRRTIIPHPAVEINISILGLLRKNLGKDLMTISLPVSINEPLSALQRQCEELEYSELLDTASEQTSSKERLLYVTAFAISGYASSQYRIGRKPFNPVLAETYECIRPDRGFRFIAEKVSHHPNVMACFAESNHFQFRQTVTGRTKFWGKSLEWIPEGSNHITLPKHNEHYTYTKPSSWVRNIVAGTRYLDHVGDMQVTNHATGEYAIPVMLLRDSSSKLESYLKDAEIEKNRIEQAQRERRKKFDNEHKHWSPIWFEKRVDGSDPTGESWFYKGGYWEARSKGEWPGPSFDLW